MGGEGARHVSIAALEPAPCAHPCPAPIPARHPSLSRAHPPSLALNPLPALRSSPVPPLLLIPSLPCARRLITSLSPRFLAYVIDDELRLDLVDELAQHGAQQLEVLGIPRPFLRAAAVHERRGQPTRAPPW